MKRLNTYLATNDWQGKAGAYGIQGPPGALIPWIQGSFTAVVGLPLTETAGLLRAAGYPFHKDMSHEGPGDHRIGSSEWRRGRCACWWMAV